MCENYGCVQCYNCMAANMTETNHRADRDQCPLLAKKTISLNKWIIEILVGERIIKSPYEICKNPRPEDEDSESVTLTKIIQKEFEKRSQADKAEIESRLAKQDKEIEMVKQKVVVLSDATTKLTNDVASLDLTVQGVKQDIQVVKTEVSNVNERLMANHSELILEQAQARSEMSNNFSLMFNMMQQQKNAVQNNQKQTKSAKTRQSNIQHQF